MFRIQLLLMTCIASAFSQQTLPASCTPACVNIQDASTVQLPLLSAAQCSCYPTASLQICSACYADLNPAFAQSLGNLASACMEAANSPPPSGSTPKAGNQPKCPIGSGPLTIPIVQPAVTPSISRSEPTPSAVVTTPPRTSTTVPVTTSTSSETLAPPEASTSLFSSETPTTTSSLVTSTVTPGTIKMSFSTSSIQSASTMTVNRSGAMATPMHSIRGPIILLVAGVAIFVFNLSCFI